MILTQESGTQEDLFDEKKWRQKILWYHPFKHQLGAKVDVILKKESIEAIPMLYYLGKVYVKRL